ncbi:MAG: GAF domain-containing protein [Microscillaceae bacterium]|nr:GAF domain-containing protein [Microscillaceae bacterium]
MNVLIKLWRLLTNIGVYQDLSFQLQQRIRLSNQLSLIVSLSALSFIIIDIFTYGYFTALPMLVLFLVGSSIPLFNHIGFNGISRLILSVAPPLGTLILNLSIKLNHPEKIGLIHYITPRMIIIAFISIPLILFTTGESLFLGIALSLILFMGTMGYGYAHEYFNVSYKDLNIEASYYDQIIREDIILLLLILVLGLLFFRYLNFQYETRTTRLLFEAQEKNKKLNERETHLERTLEEVRKSREEDKKRNWESKGLARFANLLRSRADEDKLYNILLSGIVKYVDASQGGLYLLDQDKFTSEGVKEVNMVACYAYSRQKIEQKTFQSHQGLIGQCLASAKTLTLTDIPDDYLKISTGLGYTKPRFLIVLPISFHDHVQGVLELAFIKNQEAYKIRFLEKLSENIGGIIVGSKINENSSQIYKEYQQTLHKLKIKEEENAFLREQLNKSSTEQEMKEEKKLDQTYELENKNSQENLQELPKV